MKSNNKISSEKNLAQKIFSKINTTNNKIIMKTMLLCIFLSLSFAFVSEKTGWLEVDWKIIFIPALLVLQIIIIGTALKNRYKKH
ncbi:Transmembrane Fragile-X-F protein [Flavobacterium chilense]|uniref:Transmembrane Fragile-X-F protein n=2 Tax=Flavobacterium chilense TaxID=946677 RepID=A0A1M7G1I8_9FLAO|nr:Transmembrane Fragile-X-F protein [Flavobacterium chilense]